MGAIRYEICRTRGRQKCCSIDIKYCGVNHLDIWTRMGVAGKKIKLPHVCGCDIVGTVRKGAGFSPAIR